MKKYICECCNGQINRATMRCEYCGTAYEEQASKVFRIETYKNPIKTFDTVTRLPMEAVDRLGSKGSSELVMRRVVNELAQMIAPMAEIQCETDPTRMEYSIHARMKIVQPVNTDIHWE